MEMWAESSFVTAVSVTGNSLITMKGEFVVLGEVKSGLFKSDRKNPDLIGAEKV